MIRHAVLLLMLIAPGCAAHAGAGAGSSGDECRRRADPIPFSAVFDSARAADILVPLIPPGDTTHAWLWDGAREPLMSIDTVSIPDSTAREQAEERLLELARLSGDDRWRATETYRDESGVVHFTARPVSMCRPVIDNQDELVGALMRAQSQIMRNGSVILHILVDTAGVPAEVRIDRSSGNDFLDAAAVGVGYVARFTPAFREGERVQVWAQLPITFVLPAR